MAISSECVLFLDIDGVLVTSRGLVCDFELTDDTLVHDPLDKHPPLERRCLTELKKVIDHT